MDPEQIILDDDFDDGSTDGGYGEYDFMQQDQDALSVSTPLELQAQRKSASVSATRPLPLNRFS